MAPIPWVYFTFVRTWEAAGVGEPETRGTDCPVGPRLARRQPGGGPPGSSPGTDARSCESRTTHSHFLAAAAAATTFRPRRGKTTHSDIGGGPVEAHSVGSASDRSNAEYVPKQENRARAPRRQENRGGLLRIPNHVRSSGMDARSGRSRCGCRWTFVEISITLWMAVVVRRDPDHVLFIGIPITFCSSRSRSRRGCRWTFVECQSRFTRLLMALCSIADGALCDRRWRSESSAGAAAGAFGGPVGCSRLPMVCVAVMASVYVVDAGVGRWSLRWRSSGVAGRWWQIRGRWYFFPLWWLGKSRR